MRIRWRLLLTYVVGLIMIMAGLALWGGVWFTIHAFLNLLALLSIGVPLAFLYLMMRQGEDETEDYGEDHPVQATSQETAHLLLAMVGLPLLIIGTLKWGFWQSVLVLWVIPLVLAATVPPWWSKLRTELEAAVTAARILWSVFNPPPTFPWLVGACGLTLLAVSMQVTGRTGLALIPLWLAAAMSIVTLFQAFPPDRRDDTFTPPRAA